MPFERSDIENLLKKLPSRLVALIVIFVLGAMSGNLDIDSFGKVIMLIVVVVVILFGDIIFNKVRGGK